MVLTRIPADSQVGYAASLLLGNAAMLWREKCEGGHRIESWEDFKAGLRGQFRIDNLVRRARDDLYALRQKEKESVANFLHKFRQVCIRISMTLSEDREVGQVPSSSSYKWEDAGGIKSSLTSI